MRFRQLHYFCKIVECGSFSRAAAMIHIAQSALSQQIAELEAQMGVRLLQRSARGVRATRAGETFFREATTLLKQLEQLPALVRSTSGVVEGSVALGITSILGPRLTTSIVAACRDSLPKVALRLISSDSATLCERVEAHTLDAAVLFENDISTPPLTRQPLFRQRLYLAGGPRPDGPLDSISLPQLARLPLVMPGHPHVTRVLLDQSFRSAGLSPTIVAEVDDLPSTLAAVRAGMGGTVIMGGIWRDVGASDLPPTLIVPPLYVTASIVSDSEVPLTRAGEAVRELLIPLIKKHLRDGQLSGSSGSAITDRQRLHGHWIRNGWRSGVAG